MCQSSANRSMSRQVLGFVLFSHVQQSTDGLLMFHALFSSTFMRICEFPLARRLTELKLVRQRNIFAAIGGAV